jgi:hypothetical protein
VTEDAAGAGLGELATVALLGTARREPRADGLPEPLLTAVDALPPATDPAERLLDLAALGTLYRRAGMTTGPARALPDPAPADGRRVAGPAASARLDLLLATGDGDLLPLWLTTANGRGIRPPEAALPAMLDLAVRHRDLAPLVAVAAGARGRWLARFRPQWEAALGAADRAAATPVQGGPSAEAGPPADDLLERAELWQLGTPTERRAWLVAVRRADPTAARELLAAGWAKEVPAERPALLSALEGGLSAADEPFLEAALADRRTDVRATAARMLSLLPGSAYGRRAAERARAAVRPEAGTSKGGRGGRLLVRPPAEHDAGMARDQVPSPPGGRQGGPAGGEGPGAWLLLHVVAAAPLRTWLPELGATPAEVTRLEVADGWRPTLWEAWARAAVRERDGDWAAALLADPPGRPTRDPKDEVRAVGALLELLPPADRAEPVARLVTERGAAALPVLGALPAPWPEPVARAVLHWLEHQHGQAYEVRPVLELAGRRLPVEFDEWLREAAMDRPFESPWRAMFRQAADLITFRRELLEELQ